MSRNAKEVRPQDEQLANNPLYLARRERADAVGGEKRASSNVVSLALVVLGVVLDRARGVRRRGAQRSARAQHLPGARRHADEIGARARAARAR